MNAGFTLGLALLLSVCACTSIGSSDSDELILVLDTADGLQIGDAVLAGQKEVGRIARLWPVVGHVEASARFRNSFRPSRSARFELARREDGRRFIRVSDTTQSALPLGRGARVLVQLTSGTVENRLWIVR